jgi:hypothetical protein
MSFSYATCQSDKRIFNANRLETKNIYLVRKVRKNYRVFSIYLHMHIATSIFQMSKDNREHKSVDICAPWSNKLSKKHNLRKCDDLYLCLNQEHIYATLNKLNLTRTSICLFCVPCQDFFARLREVTTIVGRRLELRGGEPYSFSQKSGTFLPYQNSKLPKMSIFSFS